MHLGVMAIRRQTAYRQKLHRRLVGHNIQFLGDRLVISRVAPTDCTSGDVGNGLCSRIPQYHCIRQEARIYDRRSPNVVRRSFHCHRTSDSRNTAKPI